jgi:hypothetical protein
MDIEMHTAFFRNDVETVRSFITNANNREHLVYGKLETGETLSLLAAGDGHVDMVRMLPENGAHVNCTNAVGRTPLMETALWGWSDVADFLINHGAEKNMTDPTGLRAIDLAQDLQRNEDERARRSGLYVDDVVRRRHRRAIVGLLADGISAQPQILSSRSTINHWFFSKDLTNWGPTISILKPNIQVPVANLTKTMALLYRGDMFSIKTAVSGWTRSSSDPDIFCNIRWTDEVFNVGKQAGYSFPPHSYDRDVRGRYAASHAEKQLILAYFILMHRFLDDELEDPKMFLLAQAQPVKPLPEAFIIITQAQCPECAEFQKRVEDKFQVRFRIAQKEVVGKMNS